MVIKIRERYRIEVKRNAKCTRKGSEEKYKFRKLVRPCITGVRTIVRCVTPGSFDFLCWRGSLWHVDTLMCVDRKYIKK